MEVGGVRIPMYLFGGTQLNPEQGLTGIAGMNALKKRKRKSTLHVPAPPQARKGFPRTEGGLRNGDLERGRVRQRGHWSDPKGPRVPRWAQNRQRQRDPQAPLGRGVVGWWGHLCP